MPIITFGLDVRRPSALERRSTVAILGDIQAGTWQSEVETVRSLPSDSPEQKSAKLALPYATWAGSFAYRSNNALVHHSGQCGIDLDELGVDRANAVLQTAVVDHFCLAAFRSARGEGVRLIFRVPPCSPNGHKETFDQVAEHVRRTYQHEPEASGSDVSRASFVSYDNGLWLNAGARVLPIKGAVGG